MQEKNTKGEKFSISSQKENENSVVIRLRLLKRNTEYYLNYMREARKIYKKLLKSSNFQSYNKK